MKKYKRYFLITHNAALVFSVCLLFSISSCSKKNYSGQPAYAFRSSDGRPDYKQLDYWAAHPAKKDPSDSIPESLRNRVNTREADVFFLYPTSLTDGSDPRWNAEIDDAEINAKTDYSSILYQASVFNAQCRVYAPRYRQAHIRCFFLADSTTKPYFDMAYEDVRNAFLYYLNTENKGRPIIIAGHSQGTLHAARLMKEFFDGKPLKRQLVCAYLIGMPVSENYFADLKPCKDSTATGCLVSWRSFQRGYEGTVYVTRETEKMVVVNPLSWTTDPGYVSAEFNKGGVLRNFNKIVPGVSDAQIHKNILWTRKPDVPGKILLTTKNYHVGDINLYYMNIRENVATRIRSFKKNSEIH
ncbi:MAG: DUF3089 domain-containing protein [Chitinophagaceae bacterium]|nr:DUF3089 domain-containing protein [Chitinophagaceae bacterium]